MLIPGFIRAPTNLGLSRYPDGRERRPDKLPQALVDAGFLRAVAAREIVALPRPPYPENEEIVEKTRNAPSIREFTLDLADAVNHVRHRGFLPVVAGGDCSVLLGCALGLAREGRFGLVFLDAHHAYQHPGNTDAGLPVAGADLALVTGTGVALLADLEGRRPYFREEDVFAFGFREGNPAERWQREEVRRRTGIQWAEIADGRDLGMEWLGRAVANFFEARGEELEGFWIHLDADVLDSSVMPAVDCPEPDGLLPDELAELLARLMRSPRFVGMDLTLLDPDLDPDGAARRRFIDILVHAFQAAAA